MAEADCLECNCSNISIMQLFHELKQRFPTVPDLIVSKVIQENCHDKQACEQILSRESRNYMQMQCYPGALISGTVQRVDLHPVATQCSQQQQHRIINKTLTAADDELIDELKEQCDEIKAAHPHTVKSEAVDGCGPMGAHRSDTTNIAGTSDGLEIDDLHRIRLASDDDRKKVCDDNRCRVKASAADDCVRCHCDGSHRQCCRPRTLNVPRTDSFSAQQHDYQVDVECLISPTPPGDRTRSFTSVNLTLRSPSSDPQMPIEISSGQSLTYTSASFDPRQGYQSHLQIRIGPSGGSLSAGRVRIATSPIIIRTASSCRSSCPSGAKCHTMPHIRVLLQKQRERKDILARELRKEREKLRGMQLEVQNMQATLAKKPSPLILNKLKGVIDRLRKECEMLTEAVDKYADQQRQLPLGETDEEFYRNIYTGQRHLKEKREQGDGDEGGGENEGIREQEEEASSDASADSGSWSCRVCTFRNHGLLSVCEQCEMPRLSLGSSQGCAGLLRSRSADESTAALFTNRNMIAGPRGVSASVSRTIASHPEL